jgi:DNA-binding NarL/FixJ family response regulator
MPPVPSTAGARGRSPRVTTRDLELLRHLADGLSTVRIAAAMSITTTTVRTRIRRLERRLSVTGRAQLMDCARQHDRIRSPPSIRPAAR